MLSRAAEGITKSTEERKGMRAAGKRTAIRIVSFPEGGRKTQTRKLLPVSCDSRGPFSLDTLLGFFLVIKYGRDDSRAENR